MARRKEHNAARTLLTESLKMRKPTWEVAQAILDLDVAKEVRDSLKNLASEGSWTYQMNDDFDQVDPVDTQLETYKVLFGNVSADPMDANALRILLKGALMSIGAGSYANAEEALKDYLQIDSDFNRKALKKRLRFLKRFEEKIDQMEKMSNLRNAQMQAKSRLAYMIDADKCDDLTLAFCAYLASRANRRSIFMLGGQSKAQDTLSSALEKMLFKNKNTAWEQVALVKPTRAVIARLEAKDRGRLFGLFHNEMKRAANELGAMWPNLPDRMRDEMVMVKGVDSSAWNAYAGALNTMRSAWISTACALKMEYIFEDYLPGKSPRLMASDLVWWQRNSGGELHEDTRMFAALPSPWDVINGSASCNRDEVLAAAKNLKIEEDVVKASGWLGPRAPHNLEAPAPEPALVHGVIVADPDLALTLRKCGVFSSKKIKHEDELPSHISKHMVVSGEKQAPVVLDAK